MSLFQKCGCCRDQAVDRDEALITKTTSYNSSLGKQGTVGGTDVSTKESQKVALKRLVKEFIRDAQDGFCVAFYDHETRRISAGLFKLDKRLSDISIAPVGSDDSITILPIDQVESISKFDKDSSPLPAEAAAAHLCGVVFDMADVNGEKQLPLIVTFEGADEQYRFFAACNVIRHLSAKSTARKE